MTSLTLSLGFVPLVDAAPLVAAREMGFAQAEGLDLALLRAPSWSSLRDMLAFGQVDAAHMLSPLPVAMALGLGGMATPLSAVSVLAINGDVIGVSNELASRLHTAGFAFDFADAKAAGAALAAATGGTMRMGVPFPFSMHTELVHYWLDNAAPDRQRIEVRTIPPPLMADALASGEIDAFCVGEPWGSIAVERNAGELLLPGVAVWAFAPEKVLAVRTEWAEAERHLLGRLMRAVWRASRWLSDSASRTTISEVLARPEYLDVAPEIIDRALHGNLTISPRGDTRSVPAYLEFYDGAATFPWRSQAAWMGHRLAMRHGLEPALAAKTASKVFRSDLYRSELKETGAEMPGASSKLEGTLSEPTPVASDLGRLILQPDRFFDGKVFDPPA